MNLLESVLTTTATTSFFILALGWLFRQWISTRLTASIKHELDVKIENIKSDLRRSEDLFKSEINEKDSQLKALRHSVMERLTERQAIICQRQFESIEQIWSEVSKHSPLKKAAEMMQGIKFDYALEQAPLDPKLRQFFAEIIKLLQIDPKTHISAKDLSRTRLYVSPMTWSLYMAYTTALGFTATKLYMLKQGVNYLDMFKIEEIMDMTKAVLPHQQSFIDKYGINSLDFLIDELEAAIFTSLKNEIRGIENDMQVADAAAAILKHATNALTSPDINKV